MTLKPSKPKKKTTRTKKTTLLRKRAESILAKQQERIRELSATNLKKLVHELGTHQVELEMQNEELRRAQTEIESSRRKYSDLYDFSPVGYFTFDNNGLILEANLTGAAMLGMEKRFLIGKPILNFIEPAGHTRFHDHLMGVLKTQTRKTCEINLRKKNGFLFPVQLQSVSADSGEEKIDSCHTAVIDISESKRADHAQYLASYPQLNPNPIIEVDASGNIIFINPGTERILEGLTMEKADVAVFLPKDMNIILKDLDKNTGSSIFREVTVKDRIYIEAIQLIPQFKVARIYAVDITERKKAEDSLQRSEMRYRELVQNANSAIIRWKSDGTLTFFNAYAQAFFGYREEEVVGRHVNIIVPGKESTGGDLTGLAQDIVNHPERYVNTINENICRDGRRVWMAWTNKPILNEQGQVAEILAVATDITERKQAEEALKDSGEELSAIYENAPFIMILVDEERRVRKVNSHGLAFAGSLIDEVVGLRAGDALHCLHSLDVPGGCGMGQGCVQCVLRQTIFDTIKTGINKQNIDAIMTFRHNGVDKEVPFLLSTTVVTIKKEPMVLISLVDITSRKRMEATLQVSERRLKLAAASGHLGIWDRDIESGNQIWDDRMYEIYGVTKNSFPATFEAWGKRLHQDDRERVMKESHAAVRGEKDYDTEFRILHPDGSVKYIKASGLVIRDMGGKAARIIGINWDITEQKNLEEKLRNLSMTDGLTGLYNRRGFFTMVEPLLMLAKRYRRSVFLLYADMDGLKEINDVLGHHEGDQALIDMATIFKATFRETDIIARIGGDEFVVIPIADKREDADIVTARFKERVTAHNKTKGRAYTLTISVGMSYYDPSNPRSIDDLLRQAERLMYEDKMLKQKTD